MDFTCLPGTTTDPTQPLNTKDNWGGYRSTSDFCGGVSDGVDGVAGMIVQHADLPTTGHQGYFGFDGGWSAWAAG